MSRLSLRGKLILAFAGVGVAVALVVGLLSFSVARRGLMDEIDRSLSSAAATLAEGGSVPTSGPDTGPRPGGRRDPAPEQGIIQAAQTVSAQGAVTPIVGPGLPVDRLLLDLAAQVAGTQQTRTVEVNGESYRMVALVLDDGRGVIQVAREMAEAQRYLGDLAWNTVWIGGASALVAAGFGWLLAWRITRRLRSLTGAAEKVTATGTLEVPIGARREDGRGDEVDRLAAAMHTMLADLARSRDDQRRLVQDAGHELRTPLTSLRTNISVLRRYDELSPGSRGRLLDDVEGESRELTDLVNELVELATDRRSEEQPVALDLGELAEQVAERFRRRTGRDLTVTVTAGGQVVAQPHGVERAISNLVDNALKFDDRGPVEIEVDGAAVTVSDRGPGVDAADRDHIFDRFHRATAARSLPGSGLGLAIVRDVALRHGGAVSVADRPGGGAVIGFVLGRPEVLPDS